MSRFGWTAVAAGLLSIGCETVDSFNARIELSDAVVAKSSAQQPSELLLSYGPTAAELGAGDSTLRLAVLCGPSDGIKSLAYPGGGGFGCSSEQHYLVWVAPLPAQEVGVVPCGVRANTSKTGLEEGWVYVQERPADAGVVFDAATMPNVRHATLVGVTPEAPGCEDGHGTFTMKLE